MTMMPSGDGYIQAAAADDNGVEELAFAGDCTYIFGDSQRPYEQHSNSREGKQNSTTCVGNNTCMSTRDPTRVRLVDLDVTLNPFHYSLVSYQTLLCFASQQTRHEASTASDLGGTDSQDELRSRFDTANRQPTRQTAAGNSSNRQLSDPRKRCNRPFT